jgi:4'-phosphopantetheinyl transferase
MNTALKFGPVMFGNGDSPRPPIKLDADEVQVWGFLLELDDTDLPTAAHCLSEEERERADRLVSERHRQQFVAAHVALRVLLSRYCDRRPRELIFHRTSAGKPCLIEELSIRFNLSHSHGRAVIAVARDREVGVDLEKIRPEVDVVSLATRFFSVEDRSFIASGDPANRHERFLQAWVAREAVFKAEGKGVRFPLHHDHLEFLSSGREARLIRKQRNPKAEIPVRFLSLEPGWVGAVAAEGTDWTVTCHELLP